MIEEVLQNNAMLKCIYKNAQVNAILVSDRNGYILHFNEAFQHTYGYALDDLQGKHGRVLFTEEDQKRLLPEREVDVVNQMGIFRDRNYIVHRNGSCLFADGESVLVKTNTGTPFIFKIVQNIHEQKTTEKFLRETQEFLENVISSIAEALLIIDKDQNIIKANPCFYELLDRKGEEVEGLRLSELKDPLFTSEPFARELQNAIEQQNFNTFDFEYPSKDGVSKILSVKGRLLNNEPTSAKVLFILTDVTAERKTLEKTEEAVKQRTKELSEANLSLQRSNAKLEEFAHAASHDLKEPIRKVYTFSDRIKTKLAPRMTEDEAQLFGRLENAADRMRLLIEDLLEYSHVSYQPHQKEPVDLNKKLTLVQEDLEIPIKESNAKITIGELPTVKGYRRQLQQLFQNLIANAIKYRKPGVAPEIHITSKIIHGDTIFAELPETERNKSFYLIEVRDNGIGFEQNHAEQIFKMFHRLHGKTDYSGTGIGLSIARRVVENHQGYIWAEGKRGVGALFKILLPLE